MYQPRPWQRKFDWTEAVSLYEADHDLTLCELARRFGVTECAIGNVMRLAGIKRGTDNPGKHGIIPRDDFAKLYRQFPTDDALAHHLGCLQSSVSARARRMGLKRTRGAS
jgi:hypothetical protein